MTYAAPRRPLLLTANVAPIWMMASNGAARRIRAAARFERISNAARPSRNCSRQTLLSGCNDNPAATARHAPTNSALKTPTSWPARRSADTRPRADPDQQSLVSALPSATIASLTDVGLEFW